jgi:hypothetical protein
MNSGTRPRVAGEPAAALGAEAAPGGREAPAGSAGDGWAGWQDGGGGDAGGWGAGSRSQGGDVFAAAHVAPFPGAPAGRPCARAGRPPGACAPSHQTCRIVVRRAPAVCQEPASPGRMLFWRMLSAAASCRLGGLMQALSSRLESGEPM